MLDLTSSFSIHNKRMILYRRWGLGMDKCGGGSYHGGDHGSNGKNLWCKDSWRLLRKSGQSN